MKAYEYTVTVELFNEVARDINAWSRAKGFWKLPAVLEPLMAGDPDVAKFVTDLIKVRKQALVTTETSECIEGIRNGEVPGSSDMPGFTNEEEEVADQIIRLLDYAGEYKLRIGECIRAKMMKNEGRPYMHGKAF